MKIPTLCLLTLVSCLTAHSVFAEARTIGTIEAVLDGKPKTWTLIYSDDDASHSALWVPHGAGQNMAILGGYESLDITFGKDESGHPTVSGPGSMLTINFGFAVGAKSAKHTLPQQGAAAVGVMYLPRVGDYSSMLGMEEGVVEVTTIDMSARGEAKFTGTFSGKLQSMDAARTTVTITDGRFEVEKARQMQSR
ncbi:MAG: hypothetical protein WAL92_10980 [Thiogranum sp.]